MSTNGMVFRIRKDEEDTPNIDQVEEERQEGVSLTPSEFTGEAGAIQKEEAPQVPDTGIREVILKGPIGHAYTDVLNHLLNKKANKTGIIRKENMTQLMSSVLSDEKEEEDTYSEANRAYIFVNDGRKMNLGEIDAMVLNAAQVKSGGAGYVAVAMEGMEEVFKTDVNKASVISHQTLHLESIGIPVFYTRARTMGKIEHLLGVK